MRTYPNQHLPSLFNTPFQIPECPVYEDKTEKYRNNIKELPKPNIPNYYLPHKYTWTPHLHYLTKEKAIQIERLYPWKTVFPEMYQYDTLSRMLNNAYHLPISRPTHYKNSIYKATYTPPYPYKLKPISY